MADIFKVSGSAMPGLADEFSTCVPMAKCIPTTTFCAPSSIVTVCMPMVRPLMRNVSGTYKSGDPGAPGKIVELRVDIDGRRPEMRLSGDIYSHGHIGAWGITFYQKSFVVDAVTVTYPAGEVVITGSIRYYSDATATDSIEVHIPRVSVWVAAADATAKFYTSGVLTKTYVCPKVSEYFRTVSLDLDRYQGTAFPPTADTNTDPHPADLTAETVDVATLYRRAGIDMTVTQDDVMNDPDSPDTGTTWNEAELHDLMEAHFESVGVAPSWNVWGAVVPQFGDPTYDPGYMGVMFDWGPWQPGDTHLREGAAVAYDALQSFHPTVYNSAAKRDRLFLETFVHEIGHAFNLPHTWSRTADPDTASSSFMNYPWGYPGGESSFWSNFRWEFDDCELIWMRHADRQDVIFGGRNWIGNNLTIFVKPEFQATNVPLQLEVRTWDLYELGEPVNVEVKLKNVSGQPLKVPPMLQPEDGLLRLYFARSGRMPVRYNPPVLRIRSADPVELAPGEALYATTTLSYSANGFQFQEPGEYLLRAYFNMAEGGPLVSNAARLRVLTPAHRSTEELAHILFSEDAAKFLYFGQTSRRTTLSRLSEAAEKHAKTDPAIVRHIRAALGTNAFAPFKHTVEKNGKRFVTARAAQHALATGYLESALEMLPGTERSAFIGPRFVELSNKLIAAHKALGHPEQVNKARKRALSYLEKRKAPEGVLRQYRAVEAAVR